MTGRIVRFAAGAMLLVLVATAVATRLPRGHDWAARLAGQASALPTDHWLAFCCVQAGVAACGVLPASLMAVAAGAAFGMVGGLALSAASTMLGGWAAFLLSRSILRPLIARLIRRHAASVRFDEAVAAESWRLVCLLRLSPVLPFAATSYGLGLTCISQRAYLLGTLASLPAMAGYVALGAFGSESVALTLDRAAPLRWGLPILGVAVVFLAAARVKRLIDRAASARS